MFKNIETKVVAAGAGGAIGAAFATFLLWLIGVFIAHVPADAAHEAVAKAAVPTAVADLLVALIALASALLAGYKAPHTFRQDLADPQPQQTTALASSTGTVTAQPAPVAAPAEPDAATQALNAAASTSLAPAAIGPASTS